MFHTKHHSGLHPGRLTWNLRIHPWKRKIIFQTIIFRFYVNLRGCKVWMLFSGKQTLALLMTMNMLQDSLKSRKKYINIEFQRRFQFSTVCLLNVVLCKKNLEQLSVSRHFSAFCFNIGQVMLAMLARKFNRNLASKKNNLAIP